MRDKKCIKKFCNEIADVWESKAPDWRFGQLMMNVLGAIQSKGRDPFFLEDDEMIEYFKQYFSKENNNTPFN